MAGSFDRIGLVAHPSRELGGATARLEAWAERQGARLVRLIGTRSDGAVAPPGDAARCDLLVALGGDGTTLAALHAAAENDTASRVFFTTRFVGCVSFV